MTTLVPSKHLILFILDAAVQTQQITDCLQTSLLVFGYFHLFRQNGSQHWWKCFWKGIKNLMYHLEQQVADMS